MTLAPTIADLPADAPVAASPRRHIAELDGIRGLAILGVLLHHYLSISATSGTLMLWTQRLANAGWVGVDLFFVLSGFLITGILLDTKGQSGYFKKFYARRTLRIFPLYYGVLFALFVIWPLINRPAAAYGLPPANPAWFWFYASNFLVFDPRPWPAIGKSIHLLHFWSLAVEEHFYLFWPLVIWAFSRKSLLRICLGLIAAAWLFRLLFTVVVNNPKAAYMLTPCRMDALAIGAALALLARSPDAWRWLAPKAGWILSLAILPILAIFIANRGLDAYQRLVQLLLYPLIALAAAAFITLAVTSPHQSLIAKLCRSSPLAFLGKYSYGIYVFHFLIQPLLDLHLPTTRFETHIHSHALASLTRLLACSAIPITLAFLSWHAYEKQALKLKRYFEYSEPG